MYEVSGIWYNVLAVKHGVELTLRILKIIKRNTLMESHLEGDYRLLSIRTVSKKLGIGYLKVKNLIACGQITSVFDGKKYKVPAYKLKEYTDRNTFIDRNKDESLSVILDHEAEAEEIIKSMRRI